MHTNQLLTSRKRDVYIVNEAVSEYDTESVGLLEDVYKETCLTYNVNYKFFSIVGGY